ncbi:DNA-binding transcriptional LysR family regulator [Azospirillum fermentarium]|uniref:LysR family transcriptional regulator n=1 Tax=Azospirillum fermentarium TaxID=1233114 RepID=UPI0022267FE8|nr:LysR family transcriptional regulator [Azospirillum fermentarium]MCW2246041.1 DNA-binding transcriptional LysR family regulator [Azospirillum fermentarium]
MDRTPLNELAAFAAVARHRSFRRAAAELGVSPSALSHSLRGLEERLGVRLVNRTTRSVAPTQAGQRLLARLEPALQDIAGALEAINEDRARPAGTVRLTVLRLGASAVLAPALPRFLATYPDVHLDIAVDDSFTDIVANGFDAGIRFGESLQNDMIAVPVSGPACMTVVGSPAYFARHPPPRTPYDLKDHACIRFRLPSTRALYRWEFERDGKEIEVAVNGPLTLNDLETAVHAAVGGVGLCYAGTEYVAPLIAAGRLVPVLEDWLQPFPGFFLYYPSRRQMPAALRALIDTLRYGPAEAPATMG